MSEYWKSIPKYWCKHCKDFATDTPLGRKNHDATAKHQSALKRFLRDLHRDNERAQSASENAKREVARLNALVGGGSSSSSSSSAAAPTASVAKPDQQKGERWGVATRELTADEKKRQMKELEMLGVAMPEEYRGDLALPGEWTTVSIEKGRRPLTEKERALADAVEERKKAMEEDERKRKWEELDEDEKQVRGFKIQTRSYPGAQEEEGVVDLEMLFGKGKGKGKVVPLPKVEVKEEEKLAVNFRVKKESLAEYGEVKAEDGAFANAEEASAVKREREESPTGLPSETQEDAGGTAKTEEVSIKSEEAVIGQEAAPASDGVVFKKRKVKAMRKKD